jgi:succinate dehydrogenase / fumarate reductase membrane anchor subunit
MSLKTPLGRVLGLGSAKAGTEHFIGQRVSAIGLAFLGCWFCWQMFTMDSFAYLEVIRFIRTPANSILLLLLAVTLAYHSWLGTQVVIEDYVHGGLAKPLALLASRFAHIVAALVAVYAVLRIGFDS